MDAYYRIRAKVFATPTGLRSIADEMEERCKTLVLGDDLHVTTIYGDGLEVDILIDQEKAVEQGFVKRGGRA